VMEKELYRELPFSKGGEGIFSRQCE